MTDFGLARVKMEGTAMPYFGRIKNPFNNMVWVREYLRIKKVDGKERADVWLDAITA